MTETQAIGPTVSGGWLSRFTAFLFSGVVYLTFLFTILYAVGFVSGLAVPKTIDTGTESGVVEAIVINLALMSLFAIQHSVMTRKPFKHWATRFIPHSIRHSARVLCACLTLSLLFWHWRPLPEVVWHVQEPEIAMVIATVSFIGWVVVFTSTLLIDHFEASGHPPAASNPAGHTLTGSLSRAPLFHRIVRHRICLGLVVAFWATPTMSVGHLLFAGLTTAYICVGMIFEGGDLVGVFGDEGRYSRQYLSMQLT